MHTDAKKRHAPKRQKKKTPRVRFFFSTRRVEIYSTNENGAFAHVSGASEVTVKHNLGALKHKTALLSTHTSEEDRRQVASTLPRRNNDGHSKISPNQAPVGATGA